MTGHKPGHFRRLRDVLEVVATSAVIVLCGTVVWALAVRQPASGPRNPPPRTATRPPAPLPVEPVAVGGVSHGNNAAKLALIVYSEFKCPFCGVFARDTMPALSEKYIATGKVQLVFRHFPLDGLHPFARKAAQAAECASQQGRFTPLHDAMFANQAALDGPALDAHLSRLGLKNAAFDACMNGPSAKRVDEDVEAGRALGVTGTPTFFIGVAQADRRFKLVQRIGGARPLKDFEAALDRWLAEPIPVTTLR
jgi:NhaA family Na+:H+ antiporter